MKNNKQTIRRKIRTRSKVQGTHERPRLSVFRSNKFFYGQLIDDVKQVTVLGVSEKLLGDKKEAGKTARAKQLGLHLATLAGKKKITAVVFDKGSYKYHGRVKAFADGAREGGLIF